jgi:hypothetical protein
LGCSLGPSTLCLLYSPSLVVNAPALAVLRAQGRRDPDVLKKWRGTVFKMPAVEVLSFQWSREKGVMRSTFAPGVSSGTQFRHKGGTATLMVDGQQVAQGRIERTIPFRISADETLDIGEDTGTPVSEDYQVPFRFSGDLKKVAIQLTDATLSAEDEAEIRRIRAEIGLSE